MLTSLRLNPGRGSRRKRICPMLTCLPMELLNAEPSRPFSRFRLTNGGTKIASKIRTMSASAQRPLRGGLNSSSSSSDGVAGEMLMVLRYLRVVVRLPNDVERTAPARFGEEVGDHVHDEADPVADGAFLVLVARSLERPVDEHWTPDDVRSRDESPVAAVFAHVTIIAHPKIAVGRHDDIPALDVRTHGEDPLLRHVHSIRRRILREVVAIARELILRDLRVLVHHVALAELLAVPVKVAMVHVQVVAWNADDALHDVHARRVYGDEYNNVP